MIGALDFSDVAGDGAALDALSPELNPRLFTRWNYGPNPLAAGAALLRRGDLRAMQGVLGAALLDQGLDLLCPFLAGIGEDRGEDEALGFVELEEVAERGLVAS